MILTYSKEKFKADILNGNKIHTLRTDKHNRWKKGMKINHWLYNPRHKHIKPAHQFLVNKCTEIQEILISRDKINQTDLGVEIYVDGYWLDPSETLELIKNDGLDLKQFKLWFLPNKADEWEGKIIHWTDKLYLGLPF